MEKQEKKAVQVHVRPAPPALASVTPLEVVAGKNPKAINLKDHPDLSGKMVVIVEARFAEGEMGSYVIFGCYVVASPEVQPTDADFCVIMTGSENVVNRIAAAAQEKAFPVSGVLRQSGRAWFLD